MSRFVPSLLLMALVAGCVSAPAATSKPAAAVAAASMATVLPQLAANVILPAYKTLDTNSAALATATLALQAAPTDAKLQAARAAWRTARTSYEITEGHLLGPAQDKQLDPALDSWPVDKSDLDKVLASTVALTPAFIGTQQPTVKGFHAIEYLLFGFEAKDLTPRQLAYAAALATDIQTNATTLDLAWQPSSGNFTDQYSVPAAGKSFATADAAFAETLHAMSDICGEVANDKIAPPLDGKNALLEESHYSNNSLLDFENNLAGVKLLYVGHADGGTGAGISDLVAAKNPAIDSQARALMDAAVADLKAVPGTFGDAITQHPDALRKAQASALALRDYLQKDVSVTITGKTAADAS